jgi:hypothetical protein
MGQHKGGQERLFHSFNLEHHVPQNHRLRGIDRCLDVGGLRQPRRAITATPDAPRSIPN